jgi:hypothetical protein
MAGAGGHSRVVSMAEQRGRKRSSFDLSTQTKPNKKAMQRQVKPEKAEIEEEFGLPDAEAVLLVKNELNLTEKEVAVLGKAIFKLKDDPLIVIKRNPNWRRLAGTATASTILDAIAVHNMPGVQRRDDMDGCRRWIFQFRNSSDINPCKAAIRALHPSAFAVSAEVVAALGGVALPANLRAQVAHPLGKVVVINKISTSRSDVLHFPFFFF